MGITEEQWKDTKKIDFGNTSDLAESEAKAWKTIWSAGQGVTSIKDSPSISELVPLLKEEFVFALDKQKKLLVNYS
jgi:nitronate monooxygenase